MRRPASFSASSTSACGLAALTAWTAFATAASKLASYSLFAAEFMPAVFAAPVLVTVGVPSMSTMLIAEPSAAATLTAAAMHGLRPGAGLSWRPDIARTTGPSAVQNGASCLGEPEVVTEERVPAAPVP